ncbi:MAG: hypothetical protein JWL68_459 [Actinomycetia bacterium]|nr:hypothetical protein [Actinomycetes bacterium]
MAIAALVLWVLTAAAGLVLLLAGSAARRAAAQQKPAVQQPVPFPAPPVTTVPAAGPAQPAADPAPSTAGPAEPPPIPRVTVHATPGEHPLLEFSHPLLGLIGLGVWFIFVGTHHTPLAWASFGILVAAIAAGLSWLTRNQMAARRGDRPAQGGFPPRLVLLHGFTATATLVLALLTALTASHP